MVEPAFTRLRASQPEVEFAGIVSKGAAVSVQVSRGRSLESKPGLNIVGGIQPRGPRDISVLDIFIICLFRCRIGCAVGVDGADIVIDISSVADALSVMEPIDVISIDAPEDALDDSAVSGGDMDIGAESEDAIDIDVVSEDSMDIELESSDPKHKFGPQSRTACGKHCTLPMPLASRLSTQCGNTPVRLYSRKTISETS